MIDPIMDSDTTHFSKYPIEWPIIDSLKCETVEFNQPSLKNSKKRILIQWGKRHRNRPVKWSSGSVTIERESKGKSVSNVQDSELELIFNGLVEKWRQTTGGYSLTVRRYAHQSYQSILALEPKKDVISLILRELERRPDRWFEALKALTNTNPAQNAATFEETVRRWIEWGKQEKYIS